MSEPVNPTGSSLKPTVPESPTTARPLELDDDDLHDLAIVSPLGHDADVPESITPAHADVAPPKPPRPLSERQQNELMLKEAFPTVEMPVVKAVLTASRGRLEPAFHALLEMTDPDSARPNDPLPPPQPPRPSETAMSQLESDELYARQLSEHYQNVSTYEARSMSLPQGNRGYPPLQRSMAGERQQAHGQEQYKGQGPGQQREYSFLDDELPVIRDNLKKGFIETQSKVNSWFQTLKKKLDDSFDEPDGRIQAPSDSHYQPIGNRQSAVPRRNTDYHPYDADPQVLSDDFAGFQLNDGAQAASWQQKPLPIPNLLASKSQGNLRKVSFREAIDDTDIYDSTPPPPVEVTTSTKAVKPSKWQPLSTVDPHPISESDPFSLGDSDDDREAKPLKHHADTDVHKRVSLAAAEAMADGLFDSKSGDGPAKTPSKE